MSKRDVDCDLTTVRVGVHFSSRGAARLRRVIHELKHARAALAAFGGVLLGCEMSNAKKHEKEGK